MWGAHSGLCRMWCWGPFALECVGLVATAERYQDRKGVSRVKGTADLKGTQ
jgi:hypothetical protein